MHLLAACSQQACLSVCRAMINPPLPPSPCCVCSHMQAGQELYWQHFFNRDAMIKCLELQQRKEAVDELGIPSVGGTWVQGWEQVVVALHGAAGGEGTPQASAAYRAIA